VITLERIRLVGWHYFEDALIEIGNRCLLAGDNGSGKSTIVDAIQYAMAADLRKARFNAAAGERKGGRDLLGYVRCKLGSDATEYLRGDAAAHVMLEFSDGEAGFTAGVCVEAFVDGRLTEHFWLGTGLLAAYLEVRSAEGAPYSFRQFRDHLNGLGTDRAQVFDSKRLYLREFTAKLGVYRRIGDYNPYLEAFTRSVSFTPLVSVDKFVCDYILEDRPVEIAAMKANLESYKEAEREAKAAELRIDALRKLISKAGEWRKFQGFIIRQEYLKLAIERSRAFDTKAALGRKLAELEEKRRFLEREIASLDSSRMDWDHERQETEAALARNDAHNLYRRIQEKIERLSLELGEEEKKAERFRLYHSQCEALLGRNLAEDPGAEIPAVEAGEAQSRSIRDAARREKEAAGEALRDALTELAELERGQPRYDGGPTQLKAALEEKGIDARFLADLTEVTAPDWVDAAEGWLNTLRFAVLVDPKEFQRALEIYDALPRSVAGAFLPNLDRMRNAKSKEDSLARLVKTSSPYARYYIDFILGDVMCADIKTLKNYPKAVTKDCMTYSNFTASRISEQVYRRHYLGQAARRERRDFLLLEADRLRRERDQAEAREQKAGEEEERFRRVYRTLWEMDKLLPSLERCRELSAAKRAAEEELVHIDTKGFRELQEKRDRLLQRIQEAGEELRRHNQTLGKIEQALTDTGDQLEAESEDLERKEAALRAFGEEYPANLEESAAYAEEQIKKVGVPDLLKTYESTLKNFRTRAESLRREYHALAQNYDRDFNALLSIEPQDSTEAEKVLDRLVTSELPEYREKIERTRRDAEREFKDHFIAILNERIEDTRESFKEINSTLKSLSFGRDQYRFVLEERSDRRGQLEIVRKAAEIPSIEDGLFEQFADPAELKAAQELFERILNASLDSPELRSISDYRTYFHYDIKIRDAESMDPVTGKPVELSLSKVLREKSGGEAQTPYYVAIAASFYRFFQDHPDKTVRLVMFDEAFNRMDDERIGKILEFYRKLDIQIISAVPTEKIEAMLPQMDRINLVIRHDRSAFVRTCARKNGVLSLVPEGGERP
jgi:uncharacterized protein YPO0396